MFEVRELTTEDAADAYRLGSVAFGYHDRPIPESFPDRPGRTTFGVFEGTRLVAKAVDLERGQWFGGRVVPTAAVAGVAVTPEVRAKGLARMVLTELLRRARERGAAISTLFPTTPFPYRALGWEEVGALTYLAIPTAALAANRDGGPLARLRPATEADLPAIERLYRDVARASTGMMERSGPDFAVADVLTGFDGVTVAEDQDQVIGYATWDRSSGYDTSSRVKAYDVIGERPEATRALMGMLAGWQSVAPTTVLRLTSPDPAFLGLASSSMSVDQRKPWMLRLVDAARAVEARGWPSVVEGEVDLDVADEVCPWHAGPQRLILSGGEGRLEPGGTGTVRITSRGLALWYAGAATPAVLRRAGHLEGADAKTGELLAVATAGPAPALHDYF
ncbi:GNAT family N-acetyltransferase [Hamadaea tsunoensis]|uniref:GNAT family N-acetyltransferase n=1 Tax=Hamadaea tsunoensis TaxID=53368 RepID=UPI000425DA8A|nr:GNAT family N-acetyltransferase [Hamadaea tsunoensis]